MTFVSLKEAAQHLGIDAKTLQRWLAAAHLVPQPHATDRRQKGVSLLHLHQLAGVHQRSLPALAQPESRSVPLPSSVPTEGLAALAHLTEQLVALEQHLQVLMQRVESALPAQAASPAPKKRLARPKAPPSAPKLPVKPTHVLPRVEYAGEGHYVIIVPMYGVLPFEPDSREWVGWLSVQTSLRFVGQQGHLTAHREVDRLHPRPWRAWRKIRNHTYHQPLAHCDQLTIAMLEQAAATLQAHLR